MDIQRLFEKGVQDRLFTDFDVCVRGPIDMELSGGEHVAQGARLFDVASLTKAVTHLILAKMFSRGEISPDDSYSRFIPVNQSPGDDRTLRHFLSYAVQSYGFDYVALRNDTRGRFKEEIVSKGFGPWVKKSEYDNTTSAYLGILLEKLFGTNLEDIFQTQLFSDPMDKEKFLFHPVKRGVLEPRLIVPNSRDESRRGRVHDPLSFNNEDTELSVAGLFAKAKPFADAFHKVVNELIESGFYDEMSEDQLPKLGINGDPHGLGFDKPRPHRFPGLTVDKPLIFTGFTGGRIFFARKPRITVCFLTNFVLFRDGRESLERFKAFCWQVLNEALRCAI